MKILIVGNGGRESAIAYQIFHSPSFIDTKSKLYITVGNPGVNSIAEPVPIAPTDIKALVNYALDNKIDFTVVGPEQPLANGIVDEFIANGLRIFGPSKSAARIESSKIFAKNLMAKYSIPTAKFQTFSHSTLKEADELLRHSNYPLVIKADGLAAGKGVVIAQSYEDARKTIEDFTRLKVFGSAGEYFVVEEFLQGYELSLFILTDGNNFVCLPYAQDHKKVGEKDTGKNTGGMGAYAPADVFVDETLNDKIQSRIVSPILNAMASEGITYTGCLYCGLMIINNEPYVIEFNCRFGDPETQVVLPLIKSDFLELLLRTADRTLSEYKLSIENNYAFCVILASNGYPDKYETGFEVTGLDQCNESCLIFHSGTKSSNNKIITSGGRVLSVVGLSKNTMREAKDSAYNCVQKIHFKNKYYRRDIGFRYFEKIGDVE
ncbi:MAG: phosphoribosylamine--glycine ligase [Ignavibacteria bacterium]